MSGWGLYAPGTLLDYQGDATSITRADLYLEDLTTQVDAVLLAGDDPENHVARAKPFLDANIPIFIDKPRAYTRDDLEYFRQQHEAGKLLMSCSSFRYAAGVLAAKEGIDRLGPIKLVVATGPKDWKKDGIHYLKGVFSLLDDPIPVSVKHVSCQSGRDIVYVEFDNGIMAAVSVIKGISAAGIEVFGSEGKVSIEYGSTYVCCKANLVEAIRSLRAGQSRVPFEKTYRLIDTLIAGCESLEQQGATIKIKCKAILIDHYR